MGSVAEALMLQSQYSEMAGEMMNLIAALRQKAEEAQGLINAHQGDMGGSSTLSEAFNDMEMMKTTGEDATRYINDAQEKINQHVMNVQS